MNILITGCSSGLGLSLAENLAKNFGDFNIIATARDLNKLSSINSLNQYENIYKYQLDVTSIDSIVNLKNYLVDDFGKLDIIVNNAGIDYFCSFLDADLKNIDNLFQTNLFGVINLIRNIMPIFSASGGLIINISSQSSLSWSVGSVYYSITKYALDGLSINLAAENRYHNNNVRVLTVNCGPFKTNIFNNELSGKFSNLKKYPKNFKDGPDIFSIKMVKVLQMYINGSLFKQDYYRRILLGDSAIAKAKWLRNHIDYSIKLSNTLV